MKTVKIKEKINNRTKRVWIEKLSLLGVFQKREVRRYLPPFDFNSKSYFRIAAQLYRMITFIMKKKQLRQWKLLYALIYEAIFMTINDRLSNTVLYFAPFCVFFLWKIYIFCIFVCLEKNMIFLVFPKQKWPKKFNKNLDFWNSIP